jgi:WD40 repeat protein
MASRGSDGTLKLWDLRKFKQPLAVWDGLDTNYANTSCCFSPDERLLLTGMSVEGVHGGVAPILGLKTRKQRH